MTTDELSSFRKLILDQAVRHDITFFKFSDEALESVGATGAVLAVHDEEGGIRRARSYPTPPQAFLFPPFAVVSSEISASSQEVVFWPIRQYQWGACHPFNRQHSDCAPLKQLLMEDGYHDIKAMTKSIYSHYKTEQLNQTASQHAITPCTICITKYCPCYCRLVVVIVIIPWLVAFAYGILKSKSVAVAPIQRPEPTPAPTIFVFEDDDGSGGDGDNNGDRDDGSGGSGGGRDDDWWSVGFEGVYSDPLHKQCNRTIVKNSDTQAEVSGFDAYYTFFFLNSILDCDGDNDVAWGPFDGVLELTNSSSGTTEQSGWAT